MANQTKQLKRGRKSSRVGLKVKGAVKLRNKRTLRPRVKPDRVLRLRSNQKANECQTNDEAVNVSSAKAGKRGRRKKHKRVIEGDEYAIIRKRLRYRLNRMNYEKSLITAYSAEGWRGSSLEKVKPENELQRAQSEIARQKLKIRDLMKHVDTICATGKLPESLFDSEGQIDSEDIFCAKCGSKDLTLDNDIILCDGVCDRGFHQYCLAPPLLKEDIPADEDGWLCPGCDCKVDCIDLLNELQGTKLSINSSWEQVFPEVSSSAANGAENNLPLPPDESGDHDYNPGESSSDESVCINASEKLVRPNLENSSDESEDNDYDPDKLDDDDGDDKDAEKAASSSSDFSSDSEDLDFIRKDGEPSMNGDDGHSPASQEEMEEETATLVHGKRKIAQLDYKKLYDEAYGNAGDDSSEDEDYVGNKQPQRVKRRKPVEPAKHGKRRGKESGGIRKASSASGRSRPPTNRRLGSDARQRLQEFFEGNRYPERGAKQSLARELGLSFQQVYKWFDNARWLSRRSLPKHHHPRPSSAL